jgi:predicted RNA binding protein YcfA (HicA-like mRNA interferase family)
VREALAGGQRSKRWAAHLAPFGLGRREAGRVSGRLQEHPKRNRRHGATACYRCEVKVIEMLKLLHQDGWALVATKGSHRQYKHGSKPGRVTVPGKPSDDLALGTQNSILKQAGLK